MSARVPITKRDKVDNRLALLGYGALVVDDSLPAEHQEMLERLRAGAALRIAEATKNDTRRPNIYFDFIDDGQFNAIATVLEDDYLILVTSGAVVSLPTLFRNLFSLPQFLPDVGDPSVETEVPPVSIGSASHHGSVVDAMPYPERLPNCSIRSSAAARFSQTAMNFLLLHELGHIRNGHLRYPLPGATGQLAEMEAVSQGEGEALARHTLENDADSHAVVHGVNETRRLTGPSRADDRTLDEAMYATSEASLYAYLLPIYALLRCFSRGTWTADTIWTSTHPPPAMRQYLLAPLVDAHLSRRNRPFVPREKIYEIAGDVIAQTERGLSALTGSRPDLAEFDRAAKLWPSYGRQLTEYWITAFPTLETLKLGGRLAPPDPWRDGDPELEH